jgi:hypothetical protein
MKPTDQFDRRTRTARNTPWFDFGEDKMPKRKPKTGLYWHCDSCHKTTEMKITKMPSEWVSHPLGFRGYQRWHQCECGNYVTALEVNTDELFKLELELKQLRKTKSEHEQLLAALRDRNVAEQRISALVAPVAEAPSKQIRSS